MPKDLKVQLANWKTQHAEPLPSSKPLTPKEKRLAAVEAAAALRRAEAEREESLDDSDLFARAVEGIQGKSEAILSKYDATPGHADRPSDAKSAGARTAADRPDDRPRVDPNASLFLDAVADIPKHRRNGTPTDVDKG